MTLAALYRLLFKLSGLPIVSVFIICTITISGHGMVGGRSLDNLEKESLRSVFSLKIYTPGQVSNGVAVHIGDGLLLTAYHVPCFTSGAALLIEDLQGHRIESKSGAFKTTKFNILRPDISSWIQVGFSLPLPDLAIIQLPEEIRSEIRQYPNMKIDLDQSFEAILANDSLYLIGQGATSFKPDLEDPIFQIGQVKVNSQDSQLGLMSSWSPESSFVVGRPGDSGGPLLIKRNNGEWIQIGIASLVAKKMDSSGLNVINAISYFSPFNSEMVKTWFEEILSKKQNALQFPGCKN